MRRKDKLVADKELLHQVIQGADICRVALVDGDKPYLIPMSFGFDGDFVYLHSAKQGRKIDIIRRNPHVCVEFENDVQVIKGEQPCKWSFRYATVIGHGTAQEITDLNAKNSALNQIVKHYDPPAVPHTFTEKELSTLMVFKVTLKDLVGKKSPVVS